MAYSPFPSKTEDAAHSSGDVGLEVLAVRNDTRGALAGTDGDYTPIQTNSSGDVRVDGSAVTQPVSAASLPLPSGAATAAKQPALGTAGSASADVITVQGVASMTAIKTDGSGVTQPVSGSVTIGSALPAGTNAIGKLAANSGVDIGDVDVTSLPVAFNTGTRSATTQRVTIATDDVVPASQSGTWNINNVSGTVSLPTGASTAANQSTANTALSAIQTSVELTDDAIKADDAAFTPGTTKVMMAGFEADETSTDSVDEGDAGAARMTLDRKQIVAAYAHTAGGYTPGKLISAATTNATSVKGSAGTLGYITASNTNASPRYLKIYNKATAATIGTDTPIATFLIPGNTAGAGTNIPLPPQGMALGTGISFGLTTGVADSDTGAVAANEIVVNYGYN